MGNRDNEKKDTGEPLGQVLFEGFTWFVRFVVSCAVSIFVIWIAVFLIVPLSGETLIQSTGIDATTTMAKVMAVWLVPQLLIAGLCGYATVRICKWVWRKTGEFADAGNKAFRARHESRNDEDGKKLKTAAAEKKEQTSGSSKPSPKPKSRRKGRSRRNRRGDASAVEAPADGGKKSDVASESRTVEEGSDAKVGDLTTLAPEPVSEPSSVEPTSETISPAAELVEPVAEAKPIVSDEPNVPQNAQQEVPKADIAEVEKIAVTVISEDGVTAEPQPASPVPVFPTPVMYEDSIGMKNVVTCSVDETGVSPEGEIPQNESENTEIASEVAETPSEAISIENGGQDSDTMEKTAGTSHHRIPLWGQDSKKPKRSKKSRSKKGE